MTKQIVDTFDEEFVVSVHFKEDKCYIQCPLCSRNLRFTRINKHLRKSHSFGSIKKQVSNKPDRLLRVICSIEPEPNKAEHCSSSRKTKKKIYKKKAIAQKSASRPKPLPRMKKPRAKDLVREHKRNQRDVKLVGNRCISNYLKNNPKSHSPIGKFGVPQDPFRYGCYGSKNMEFDVWRKTS